MSVELITVFCLFCRQIQVLSFAAKCIVVYFFSVAPSLPPSPSPSPSLPLISPSLSLSLSHLSLSFSMAVLSQMFGEEGIIRKNDLQTFLAAVDIDPTPDDLDSLFHQVTNYMYVFIIINHFVL